AFAMPSRNHFMLGKTLETINSQTPDKVIRAFPDFFMAGIAHFANRGHDAYMQEVGAATWWMMEQNRAQMAITQNIPEAAMQLGIPREAALDTDGDIPKAIFVQRQQGKLVVEAMIGLFPSIFLVDAQVNPIEALSSLAYVTSYARDAANEKIVSDMANVGIRAEVTAAHFLKEAVRRHPEVSLSARSQRLLKNFPEGIGGLPQAARYTGMGMQTFRAKHS